VDLALFLVAWTIIIVALTLIVQKRLERRRRTLEQQALRLGFSFGGNCQPFAGSDIRGLSVLQCDPSAIFDFTMTGKVGDSPAVICDLICAGQHCRSVKAVTIAAFRSPSGGLPVFRLGAPDLLRYMSQAMHPLRLETEREVGKGLLLQCSDNKDAGEFFTRGKLSELQACIKRFCIESSPDWVFIYQPCTRVARKELPGFIREVSAIARILLAESQGASESVSAASAGAP
jgi:hypothetical protein